MGGIENQIMKLMHGFASRDLDPILVTSDQCTPLASAVRAMGFPVYVISPDHSKMLRSVQVIERIIKEHDVQIIQSHRFRESLVCRLVKMRRPEIIHNYRVHTHTDSSYIPAWRKQTYHLLDRWSFAWVDSCCPISALVSKELIERTRIPSTRIRIIRNGVPSMGTPDRLDDVTPRPLPMRVAMVANLLPIKRFDVLIASLGILKRRGLVVQVRLIGGEAAGRQEQGAAGYKTNLITMAVQEEVLSQIEFYGYTNDVATALHGFPVLVLPSDLEGLPICLLEAMSLRKLVIASSVGGIPEMVTDKVNGLLLPPGDPQALAKVMEEVFTAPAPSWNPLREAAFRTWRDEFTVERMVSDFIELFHKYGDLE